MRFPHLTRTCGASATRVFVIRCAALIAATVIAGCELLGGSDGSRIEVADGIIFSLAEQNLRENPSDEPRLIFSMRTANEFPCSNYGIRYDLDRTRYNFDRTRNILRIRVLEVIRPGVCLTALGPATASFELPLEPGRYDLVLVNGTQIDVYSVEVSDSRIVIESRSAIWSHPASGVYWRFPRQSFGFFCGTLIETKYLCTDFEAALQDLDLTSIAVPDFGRWPYPLSTSGHYYDAPAKFYRYTDSGTWAEVKERLRTFTRERLGGRQGVGLSVRNWRGDAVRSWMVDD